MEEYNKLQSVLIGEFDNEPNHLIYKLYHSNDNIAVDNNEILFGYYKRILRTRHDLLHYFVLRSLGKKWVDETSFAVILGIPDDNNNLLNKTPDIHIKDDNINVFIDVSVSFDISKTSVQKTTKYYECIDYIEKNYDYQLRFLHINCSSSFNNLLTELEKIKKYMTMDFDLFDFNNCIDIIENKKKWVSEHIDKEYFEINKAKEFFNLSIETVGIFMDLNLDNDGYKDFNSKFDHLEKIEETQKNFDEDVLIETLKDILDNDNDPINQKFKDIICNKTQFINASTIIHNDNDKRIFKIPKPTVHFFVPEREDFDFLPLLTGKYCEQDMLLNFSNFIKETNFEKELPKFVFVKEILTCFNDMIKNDNSKINKMIFNNEDIINNNKNMLVLYKHLRKQQRFINQSKSLKIEKKLRDYFNIYKSSKEQILVDIDLERESLISDGFVFTNISQDQYSFQTFLEDNKLYKNVDNQTSYAVKSKTIFIKPSSISTISNSVWVKTGIQHEKNQPNIGKWDINDSINHLDIGIVDDFLQHLCKTTTEDYNHLEFEYLKHFETFDSPMAQNIKKTMVEQYTPFFDRISKTNSYNFLKKSHLIAQQLLHYSMFNSKAHSFSFFNIGIPNCLFIVAGCYNKVFSEDGKPFMCVVLTKTPYLYTKIYGKIYQQKIPGTDNYLVLTNWRRLPTFKLTHIKDSFYSVVSTTMNSFLSSSNLESSLIPNKYEYIFAFRSLIAICTNQRCSEILVDARYAYMSAFATHTNISKLLTEKFGPPYTCLFECWLVEKLLNGLPKLHDVANTIGIKLKTPQFLYGRRSLESIGGELVLPSVWGNYLLADIHEVLDEIFVYVHTIKEPSNTFHENVKALKVIVDFQIKYDNLPDYIKYGMMTTKTDYRNYLLHDTKIGFSSSIICRSTKLNISKEKPYFKKIIDEISSESIAELISTKAVISDLEREVVEDENITKRFINKSIKKIEKYTNGPVSDVEKSNIKQYYLKTKSKYYGEHKSRQRVIETILDVLEENPNIETTVDLANHFITNDHGKVIADICIKAQYGSKREFYVINIGAKAIARCTELFFRKISENSPNEAISIAGDQKILAMQRMLDKIYLNPKIKPNMSMKFVNGDCTKWSAAETMGSFLSMCYGLKEFIPPNMYELLCATFNSWSNKNIQIPMPIINKVVVPTSPEYSELKKSLSFLTQSNIKQTAQLKSTQNFLQGMFNYSSSYKAVCCANYTYYLWNKIYPNKVLLLEHMEHSDDYVMIVLYEDEKDFEKFRILHKIMMRFHGFNDSDRKTNSQNFFMEFVSQISFNGVMLYPQIKKSKEINANLPCTGYKNDCDAAYSRVGECMRVGCNQTFLYFFQRFHMICLAESYSLLPGMFNNKYNFNELLNTPIEFFGIPDMLPVFSLFCRGNGNNYRLFTFGNIETKLKIIFCYNLSKTIFDEEKYMSENIEYKYSLFNPKYMYDMQNKSLIKLRRNINWSSDDLLSFWNDHLSYKFLKPTTRTNLISWIKSMFFNRTFAEAYTKSSRTKMTLRVSNFIKNKILKIFIKADELLDKHLMDESTLYTINDLQTKLLLDYNNTKVYLENDFYKKGQNTIDSQLLKVITKCDPTYSVIYSILNSIKILRKNPKRGDVLQISMKTPPKITSMPIKNNPGTIIQYIYNLTDFKTDKRRVISDISLQEDIKRIKERIPAEILDSHDIMDILSVYNDLSISTEKPIVMIGYNRTSKQLPDVIVDIFSNNLYPQIYCHVNFDNMITAQDPYTAQTLYTRGHKITIDTYQQSIENMTLWYIYLLTKHNYRSSEICNFFNNFLFEINKEKKEFYDYSTVLKRFTPDYVEQFSIDDDIVKAAAFLNAELLGSNELLKYITSQIYSYTYRWDNIASFFGGKYQGYSDGYFSHSRNTSKFIHLGEESKPLLLVNKLSGKMLNLQYNIVLKILGFLKETNMNKLLYANNIVQQSLNCIPDIKKFFKNEKITTLYQIKNNEIINIGYKEYKSDELYLPIFKTNFAYSKSSETKSFISEYIPQIKRNIATVFIGKEKVYTLPFWKCRQHNNIIKVHYNIDPKINYDELIEYNNLSNYIFSKPLIRDKKNHNLLTIDPKRKIQNAIVKNRLYDFFKNDVYNYLIDDVPNLTENLKFINSILNFTPHDKHEESKLESLHQISSVIQTNEEKLASFQNFDFGLSLDDIMVDEAELSVFETGTLEQIPDFLNIEEQYLQKSDMAMLDNITKGIGINDIFVERTHKMKRYANNPKPKSFILNRLVSRPDFSLLYDQLYLINDKNKQNYNIAEFLQVLKQYIIELCSSETDVKQTIVLQTLMLLLCDTYIIPSELPNYKYEFLDNILKVCIINKRKNLQKNQIDKIKSNTTQFKFVSEEDDVTTFYFFVNIKQYIDEYIKAYGSKKIFLCHNVFINLFIKTTIGVNDDLIDDILAL